MEAQEAITSSGEAGYYSSPPSSPGNESFPSPFSNPDRTLSLGIYFSANEGENNDVIAALRASQRVIKETAEMIADFRPKTEQCRNIAMTLHAHDREFSQWIHSGLGIDSSRRIAVRSLPLYEKLAKYVNLLLDLESYLPYSAPSKVGSLLRRLSTAGPHPNSSLDHKDEVKAENPRLALAVSKVETYFDELKVATLNFSHTEKRRKATWDIVQRTRRELQIRQDICIPETRVNLLGTITSWAKSEDKEGERVMCIVGNAGSGKSAIAATLSVEWKRAGILESAVFLAKFADSPQTPGESGDHLEHRPTALSRALSSISRLRRSSSRRSHLYSSSMSLTAVLKTPPADPPSSTKVIIVDGLDHAPEDEEKKVMETLHGILSKHSLIKVVLTSRSESVEWLQTFRPPSPVTFQPMPSPSDPSNIQDMSIYVSSRLSILLSASDQQRVIDAAEGNWTDVVRLCDQVEDYGNPERSLDAVLYRELVRKHGEHVKVVLV